MIFFGISYVRLLFSVSGSAKEVKKIKSKGDVPLKLENMQVVEKFPLLSSTYRKSWRT